MTFPLFDAPQQEPSRFVGFGGNMIDRQAEHRSDDVTVRALAQPSARLMLMRGGRCYLKLAGETFQPYFSLAEAETLGAVLSEAVLLGVDADGPVVAAPGGLEPEALPDGIKAIDYRSINVQGLIDPAAAGALAQGAALLAWHASHAYCSRCGTKSEMRIGGYKRACPSCDAEHFPRTDPVAIMLAVTRERCLLGRGRHFAPGMFSALAGFIEPGETIENAVRRETLEESGIRLGRVVYHASQPWPFPYSLMIGCYGEALNEDITADTAELEACRWFTRDEVFAMIEGRHPDGIFVPPTAAIASLLIRNWAENG
ncbi:MAG: NAD(+) diphosphatase [Rhizobiaceae bacterium]|nr:NAD(+) diphosphatase [Rhizobiaceae bacterium]